MPQKSPDFDALRPATFTRRDLGRLMSAGVAALAVPRGVSGLTIQDGRRLASAQTSTPVRLSAEQQREQLRPRAGGDRGLQAQAGHRLRLPVRRRGDERV